jgi:hypothetical protein
VHRTLPSDASRLQNYSTHDKSYPANRQTVLVYSSCVTSSTRYIREYDSIPFQTAPRSLDYWSRLCLYSKLAVRSYPKKVTLIFFYEFLDFAAQQIVRAMQTEIVLLSSPSGRATPRVRLQPPHAVVMVCSLVHPSVSLLRGNVVKKLTVVTRPSMVHTPQ